MCILHVFNAKSLTSRADDFNKTSRGLFVCRISRLFRGGEGALESLLEDLGGLLDGMMKG